MVKLFRRMRRGISQENVLSQQVYIDTCQFPFSLTGKVSKTYPHLSSIQVESVMKGLRQFFQICHEAGPVMVAMPSQVVDVAWHEFILSTQAYDDFCQQAYGHFLHHTPAQAMRQASQGPQGIKRAWRLACEREGINPKRPTRLPLLFALDADLEIPDGFKYSIDCSRPGSHPYCASHVGCSGGSCGTSEVGAAYFYMVMQMGMAADLVARWLWRRRLNGLQVKLFLPSFFLLVAWKIRQGI